MYFLFFIWPLILFKAREAKILGENEALGSPPPAGLDRDGWTVWLAIRSIAKKVTDFLQEGDYAILQELNKALSLNSAKVIFKFEKMSNFP